MFQVSQPLKMAQISFIFYLQPTTRPQLKTRTSQANQACFSFTSLHTFREHGIIHSTPWHHTFIRCLPLCLFLCQPLFLLDEYFLIALVYCLQSTCKHNN